MVEIIDDPAFVTLGLDGSKWTLRTHAGVVMSSVVLAGVLSLDISRTHGANWHAELQYSPFAVKAANVLAVSFEAKAKRPFAFSVWLGQQDLPHASLIEEQDRFQSQMMTVDWRTFHHRWRLRTPEIKARLNFVLGPADNVVDIRNISLCRVDG